MAYQAFGIGISNENYAHEEIRCTSGRITHITYNGKCWKADEDEAGEEFTTRGAALDRAREIAGDPDLS